MPEFAYSAKTPTGKNVAGTLVAGNKREALCALAEQTLVVLRVEASQPHRSLWPRRKRVKARLLATNLSQLADLLQNGVALLPALGLLAEQATSPVLAEVLCDIRDRVADGTSLDQAMTRHPRVFSDLTVSMVRAGCEGAFLEDALRRTADFLELQEDLKSRLVGAMTYPAFLAGAGLLITTILVVFFVPKFASLFARLERSGQGLPLPTVMLLWISHELGRYGLVILGLLAAAVVFVRRAMHTLKCRALIDRWKLRVPLAGRVLLGYAVSRFCRVLGTLLHNGVPLLRALDISSYSAANVVLGQAIRQSAEHVSSGNKLSGPLTKCGLIPPPVMAMIRVAEESNNLDQVLVHIAEAIDRQNARLLDVLLRLVEPILLIMMGALIMFVITAMLLPVIDLGAALGH